jgi:hypothetical protein
MENAQCDFDAKQSRVFYIKEGEYLKIYNLGKK